MTKYVITGGKHLHGKVRVHGAKNAGFKEMIAALLCDSPSEIKNLSYIGDIENTTEIIRCLGGRVTDRGNRTMEIDPKSLDSFNAPKSCGLKSRAGTIFVGPLLAKFKKAVLPIPGGDKIGARPIDRHLAGLEALGATVKLKDGVFIITAAKGLRGGNFRFPKNTHTGTETLLLAAVRASGRTVLENAAAEPEVDDLITFLNQAGAKIKRTEPRTIVIDGVAHLRGATHEVMTDRNTVVTFACAALATKGEVFVERADNKVLGAFLEKVREIGGLWETREEGINFRWEKPLRAADITAAPYPAFMTDWQAVWATLMTQAVGTSEITETIFENRFGYVPFLVSMGAKMELFNPQVLNPEDFYNFNLGDDKPENLHALKITGPTPLAGKQVEANDVRMGATMILAGLVASGKTVIIDTHDQVARGYENLAENLVSLGAAIEIIPGDVVAYTKRPAVTATVEQ